MDAVINTLYESGFYRIIDFRCQCTDCRISKPEYSESFCVSFIRKGNFIFNVFRKALDSFNGRVLVSKPGYEHTVEHTHAVPDQCTIIEFRNDFYQEILHQASGQVFFRDPDQHSTLIVTNTEMEYLHFRVLQMIIQKKSTRLEMDHCVMEILRKSLQRMNDFHEDTRINTRLKRNHLLTIETAKDFISNNFTEDISLGQIARHCHISPFHFSRIFKTFTGYSPHQFLLNIRLQHSALLLNTSTLPISDIAFSSGFNSIEYFNAAFKLQFKQTPGIYRKNFSLC